MSILVLGVTAAQLAHELESWPRRRVKLADLQALLVAAEPALEHAPERRARLHEVLDELAGAGRVDLPSERSLQLFGYEKRLEALIGGQLFFPGRLTLEQLRCEQVHPPFVFRTIGSGPDVLVVENHHTYVSLSRALPRDGDVGVVVYGAGAHFKGSVTFLADLSTPRRVLYFGDLDIDGLDIPVHASAVAVAAALPAIEPATALYRLLLDHGRPVPVEHPPSLYRVRKLTASIVLESKLGEAGVADLDELLATAGVRCVAVDLVQAHAARDAYARFGNSRNTAGLNYGDCFAYALATVVQAPLLFKGEDFRRTDVVAAVA
jgi:uncharacterized protein with PIN domain